MGAPFTRLQRDTPQDPTKTWPQKPQELAGSTAAILPLCWPISWQYDEGPTSNPMVLGILRSKAEETCVYRDPLSCDLCTIVTILKPYICRSKQHFKIRYIKWRARLERWNLPSILHTLNSFVAQFWCMSTSNWANIGSGCGLLPVGVKSLPELMPYHKQDPAILILLYTNGWKQLSLSLLILLLFLFLLSVF